MAVHWRMNLMLERILFLAESPVLEKFYLADVRQVILKPDLISRFPDSFRRTSQGTLKS